MSKVKMYIPQKIHEVVTALHEDHKACEWSAFCKIIDWKDWYALIDMFFPNQDNTSWLNTTTQEWLDQFCQWIMDNEPTEMSKWKMQIHSHHSMWLFWSWTDNAQNRAWNYGWNKHFFNAVTAYSNVEATKNTYIQQTWSNVWYFWCINFYDIDLEIPMEFIIWMDSDYKAVRAKFDGMVQDKKPSLRKIAEGNVEAKLAWFEQYVTKISKNPYVVENKEDLVTKELNDLISWFIDEIKEDYRIAYQKCYDDNYVVESKYVKLNPDDALALLKANEVKKTLFPKFKTVVHDYSKPTSTLKTSPKTYTYPRWKTPKWYVWYEEDGVWEILNWWVAWEKDYEFFCNITGKYWDSKSQRWFDNSFYDYY